MEITDLVMLLIWEKINAENIQGVKAVYGYDTKRISLNPNDYIEVYSRGQNIDWLGIGGKNYQIVENVSVVVRSKTKYNYMKMREMIKELFKGDLFVFTATSTGTPIALEEGVDFDEVEYWGVYVMRFHLLRDVVALYNLQKGDYVEVVYNGEILRGWVYNIIGEDLFIFTRKGIACLIRPIRINEDSMTLRKMFQATFDIEGTLLECVES